MSMQVPDDIRQLIYRYSEEDLSPDHAAELSEWIVSSPEHAQYFYRNFAEQRALVIALGGRQIKVEDDPQAEAMQASGLELLNELAAMEANRPAKSLVDITARVLDAERKQRLEFCVQPVQEPRGPRVIIIPRIVAWGSIAAVLMLGLFLAIHATDSADPPTVVVDDVSPAPVANFVIDFASVWAGPISPTVGQAMPQGDYELLSGRAKLHFDSGALVMIESPSRFSLDSASQMTVHTGEVVAYCDVDAHGFAIQTPNAEFVDLGTEFGVRVTPGQESQLHVFKGEVRAQAIGAQVDPADSIVVRETQAVAARHQAGSLHALSKADGSLFRAMRRVELPVSNTGERLNAETGQDAHWRVTHVNGRLLAKPASTRLFTPPAFNPDQPQVKFHPNAPGHIAWITIDPQAAGTNEKSYTYQTRFDVCGMDMESLRLELGLRADNYVAQIRLNGQSIPVPHHSSDPPFDPLVFVGIEEGFVVGENTLEVVIQNLTDDLNPKGNYSALIAGLNLTARVNWKQAGSSQDTTHK